jgi:Tubulin like
MVIEITPTLVIGLGGTGHLVVHRLSQEIYETWGDIPIIQCVSIDADKRNENCEKYPNFELMILDAADPNEYVTGIKNGHFQQIGKWYKSESRIVDISSGCEDKRYIGRLALFINIVDIRRIIDEKIRRICSDVSRTEVTKRGFVVSDGLKVFIVNSESGGCGSGISFDVAFNIRDILKQDAFISGYTIMPTVFDNISEESLNSSGKPSSYELNRNAIAALKELEYFMNKKNRFTCEYDDSTSVNLDFGIKPFDYFYIIDSYSSNSTIILSYEEVIPRIRSAIRFEILSSVGPILNGLRITVHDILNRSYTCNGDGSFLQAYGTFGSGAYYYPMKEFKELCTCIYTEKLAKSLSSIPKELSKPEDYEIEVKSRSNALSKVFSVDEIKHLLSCNEKILDYENSTVAVKFDEKNKKVYYGTLASSLEQWKDAEIERVKRSVIVDNKRNEIVDNLKKQIETDLMDDLNNRTKGLMVAISIYNQLKEKISGEITSINSKRLVLSGKIAETENQCNAKMKILRAVLNSADYPFSYKSTRVNNHKNEYIDLVRVLFDNNLELTKLEATKNSLMEIASQLDADIKGLGNLRNNINLVASTLNKDIAKKQFDLFSGKKLYDAYKIKFNTQDVLDYHYNKHNRTVEQGHDDIRTQGSGIYSLLGRDFNQFNQLYDYLLNYGHNQYPETNFDINHIADDELKELVKDLLEEAKVRMTYSGPEHGFLHGNLPQFCVMGVPACLFDRFDIVINSLGYTKQVRLENTGDDNIISCVNYKYGLPLFAMKPLKQQKVDYDKGDDPIKPLHIFGIDNLPEII